MNPNDLQVILSSYGTTRKLTSVVLDEMWWNIMKFIHDIHVAQNLFFIIKYILICPMLDNSFKYLMASLSYWAVAVFYVQ